MIFAWHLKEFLTRRFRATRQRQKFKLGGRICVEFAGLSLPREIYEEGKSRTQTISIRQVNKTSNQPRDLNERSLEVVTRSGGAPRI